MITDKITAKLAALKAWVASKLTDNAKWWHRMWSIRMALLSAALSSATTAYLALPADWLPYIPGYLKLMLAVGAMLTASASGASVVVKQTKLAQDMAACSVPECKVPEPLAAITPEVPHGDGQA